MHAVFRATSRLSSWSLCHYGEYAGPWNSARNGFSLGAMGMRFVAGSYVSL